MTVTLGGIAFDGATGTPRRAMTGSEATIYAANAKGFRWTAPPPARYGAAEFWADCDQTTAQAKIRAVQSFIGRRVSMVYPHGTITPLPVGRVTGEWQAKRGTINGGVLRLAVDFEESADRKDGPDADKSLVKVQTASTLAGPWTDRAGWICEGAAEGLGTYVGEAEAWVLAQAPDPALFGKWVRLVLLADDSVAWTGVILGASVRSQTLDGAPQDARTTYRFAGLGYALAQTYIPHWYETRQSDGPDDAGGDNIGLANVSAPLDYNAGNLGDRSGAPYELPNTTPRVCYVHARGKPAGKWTAAQAVENYLTHLQDAYGFKVALAAGADAILTYDDAWRPRDKSTLDFLAHVISPDYNYTFRLVPDGTGGITVEIVDLAAAGGPVDWTVEGVTAWEADLDAAQMLDRYYAEGPNPFYLRTLRYTADDRSAPASPLWRGWSGTQEADWDLADETRRGQGTLSTVHRRFVLQWAWPGDGRRAGLVRLPYARDVDGNGWETGSLESETASKFPHGRAAWRIDRTLPLGIGKDWTDSYTKIDPRDATEGVLVWFYKADEPLEPVHYSMQVAVGDDDASLILGRDGADAATVKAKMDDGYSILATVAMRHPLPRRVSQLAATEPRTDLPRSGVDILTGDYWRETIVSEEVIFRMDDDGNWVYAAQGRIDNGGDIADFRNFAARFRMTVDGSASWVRGEILTGTGAGTYPPGTMIGPATFRPSTGGEDTNATATLGAPVTRRVWDFRPGSASTTFYVSRIVPGFRTPHVANAAGGAVKLNGAAVYHNGKK